MINLKKSLVALLLLSTFAFSVFCVPAESNETSSSSSVSESSIILSDSADNSSAISNSTTNTGKKESSSSIGLFLRMIIVLIIVVGLIFLVFYFIKKKTNYVKTDDEYLRRAAFINIAPGKSVEVITLIDKAYLIGVTEDNITLLGEINDPELINAMNINSDKKNNVKKPSTFSDVLDTFLIKGNKKENIFEDTDLQTSESFFSDTKKINEDNRKENKTEV